MPQPTPEIARVVLVDGKPRSSCCQARVQCQKDYTDTHIFIVKDADADEHGNVTEARYEFVETIDGIDGFNWHVTCQQCGQPIDDEHTDFEEG